MRTSVCSVVAILVFTACKGSDTPSPARAGAPESAKTTALELGANLLQKEAPINGINYYIDGFHTMKDMPHMMMEAHHYCNHMNEDFSQCVIYDGNTRGANLIGLEYIISEKLFGSLSAEEKKLWHPHNYEILSGTLVGPGLPAVAEKEFMKGKMNSYGKTWHVWDTGHVGHSVTEKLPVGMPKLAWSFNADKEMPDAMLTERDRRMNINSAEIRKSRQDFVPLARPQEGVDALKDAFPGRVAVPGVVDAAAATPAPPATP